MRYAVLADIHSNLEALTAALGALEAERIDRFLCLGDVMGYGADPIACLERLRSCDPLVVGGNHDLACVGKLDLAWFNDAARAAVMWTRDQLGFTDLDWLRQLPLTATEGPFMLVHGTLPHPERFEYLVDLAQAVDAMAACRTLMCLAGHTHLPCVIEYDRTRRRIERILTAPAELTDVTFRNDADGVRYLVNPGSIGQPRDGDPRASFAVIDTERRMLRVHRVRYDVERAARKIRQAGLPEFLADRLAIGR
ncbi:MAG: metallophosphoesterase family protein [Candidatus Omnitrophica bacterium]|nr:metallophosphoesterase family protein [Candidatus Omnitrophota bacterium]